MQRRLYSDGLDDNRSRNDLVEWPIWAIHQSTGKQEAVDAKLEDIWRPCASDGIGLQVRRWLTCLHRPTQQFTLFRRLHSFPFFFRS